MGRRITPQKSMTAPNALLPTVTIAHVFDLASGMQVRSMMVSSETVVAVIGGRAMYLWLSHRQPGTLIFDVTHLTTWPDWPDTWGRTQLSVASTTLPLSVRWLIQTSLSIDNSKMHSIRAVLLTRPGTNSKHSYKDSKHYRREYRTATWLAATLLGTEWLYINF
jgi:hypothetical protein